MSERPAWSTPLPRPITIPGVMVLEKLSDVRLLLDRLPVERRTLGAWQYVEKCLNEAKLGGDLRRLGAALQIVMRAEKLGAAWGSAGTTTQSD